LAQKMRKNIGAGVVGGIDGGKREGKREQFQQESPAF
jgi:hypothetical protein